MQILKELQAVLDKHKGGEVSTYPSSEFPNETATIEGFLGELNGIDEGCQIIVAGGALTSLFTNNEVNDIDIYFKSKESFSAFLAGVLGRESEYFRIVNISERSLLLTNHRDIKLQLIFYRWFETPQDIFNSFDFSVNMAAYEPGVGYTFHKDFLRHNSQRYIEVNTKTDFPVVSVLRIDKYRKKGYSISKAQMLRLLLRLSQLEIGSWADIISHCGGMYGIDPKDIFNQEVEFSIEEAISQLGKLTIVQQSMDKFTPSCMEAVNIFKEEHYIKLAPFFTEDMATRMVHGEYCYGCKTDGVKDFKEIYEEFVEGRAGTIPPTGQDVPQSPTI